MSDRVKGFVVALDKNYREEDVEQIKNAISQIKGVLSVKENVMNPDDFINSVRITNDIKKRLYGIIEELE